jgi:hypothetical protein
LRHQLGALHEHEDRAGLNQRFDAGFGLAVHRED